MIGQYLNNKWFQDDYLARSEVTVFGEDGGRQTIPLLVSGYAGSLEALEDAEKILDVAGRGGGIVTFYERCTSDDYVNEGMYVYVRANLESEFMLFAWTRRTGDPLRDITLFTPEANLKREQEYWAPLSNWLSEVMPTSDDPPGHSP